ncbi:MAG: SAM-dependent methyltransferase [Desulfurococcaceae archaeon]
MGRKPLIVIEHLEDNISIWLILEYRQASLIYGRENIMFTNVPNKYHKLLNKFGRVTSDSIVELVRRGDIKPYELIVLDPLAKEPLTYNDLVESKYVVIGGILGDHPPRGRTRTYITNNLGNVKARNIGDKQYSIDGSVYVVKYLLDNRNFLNYKFVDSIEIVTNHGLIILPYRYPVDGDNVVIADGLIEYLTKGSIPDRIAREIFSERDRT